MMIKTDLFAFKKDLFVYTSICTCVCICTSKQAGKPQEYAEGSPSSFPAYYFEAGSLPSLWFIFSQLG